jgi:hypothetical protein
MPRAAPLQSNFNAGEIDPRMLGRVDYDRLRSALLVCKNQIPRVTGSAVRRPGTYFCDEVRDSTKATRLVRFKYSTIQSYVLEFGHQYIRFKRNQGPIHNLALTLTNITTAAPAVLTYTGTDPSNGDHLDITGVIGMVEINGLRGVIKNLNTGAKTFQLERLDGTDLSTMEFGAYTSGGTALRVLQIASPYLEEDLFQLKFTQTADTLYIWHPDYPERTLTRASHVIWTLAQVTYIDGPYMAVNKTATTLTPSASAPGTGVTITASAATGINGGQGFLATDVGRLIRLREGATWGYCQITARASATAITVTIINSLTNTNAKSTWQLGLYSDTTGYPACGTFFGDRLWRAGCPAEPDRFDASMVSDYLNLSTTALDGAVTDSHAISRRLNEDDVQSIRWLRGGGSGLIVGTVEGEWIVTPSTNSEAITPTNVDAKMHTSFGSDDVQPVKADGAVISVESGGRRLREMLYSFVDNALQVNDMTVLAEHITKGDYDPSYPSDYASTVARSGVKELAYQRKPIPVVWGARRDGVLLGNTYSKPEKVTGWHRHVLGGWVDGAKLHHAEVESVCVIPSSDGSYDELWMCVKRLIDGRTVRYNEFLTAPHEQGDPREGALLVDSARTYTGSPTFTITGLHHLVGETVQLLVDGAAHPDVEVSEHGTIELNYAASLVHVGYKYNSDGVTIPYDVGAEDGTALGKIQRIHGVAFMLYETLGLEVGHLDATALRANQAFHPSRLYDIPFRTAADPMGLPPPLFTGIKSDFSWDGDYSMRSMICWRFSTTQPGEVLAILPKLHTQDGG